MGIQTRKHSFLRCGISSFVPRPWFLVRPWSSGPSSLLWSVVRTQGRRTKNGPGTRNDAPGTRNGGGAHHTGPIHAFAWVLALLAMSGSPAAAQTEQIDPLQCWWKTSASAVRVGEPFAAVLTCAVLDTDAVTVVVDQTRLEPGVMPLAPFEVLGGAHGVDLRTGTRRFFQFEYRLRLVAENQFGKDVSLPESKLSYRVQSRVGQGTALQGRDQTYLLPAQSIRILSLVPADASDIRDASSGTFSDIDQRAFRANLFVVVGGVLLSLAGLVALFAVVQLVRKYRKPATAAARLMTDGTILRGVSREFRAIARERANAGWTTELAVRALAAVRVVGTYVMGRRASYMPAGPEGLMEDGRLIMKIGWPRGKRLAISGAVTAQGVALERARTSVRPNPRREAQLEALGQALTVLTAAQYGRDAALDDAALDKALAAGSGLVRRVMLEQTWPMKRLAAWRAGTEVDNRAWSR